MTLRFLVDEDLPRSKARTLSQVGLGALDVREVGLRGHSDAEVFAYAQTHHLALITADKGFANVLSFAPGTHEGIVVPRVPNELPTARVNDELLCALGELEDEALFGLLVVVEVGRTRIRRPRS